MMRLRRAAPREIPNILNKVAAWSLDAAEPRQSRWIVAEEAGDLIGFGRLRPLGAEGLELASLGVDPDRRKSGVGRALVERLLDEAEGQTVFLATALEGFFEKFGFLLAEEPPEEILKKVENHCKICAGHSSARVLVRRL